MSKGSRTREQIIEEAAALFNRLGYQATSVNDVMKATGLQKGGIYRHFASKDELAVAAFDYAVEQMRQRFTQALSGKTGAVERLRAIVAVYERIPVDPPVPGGCPILNASVEADDTHPVLMHRAQTALRGLRRVIETALQDGQASGELRQDIQHVATATTIIACLEGAVMLSTLHHSQTPMRHVVRQLQDWFESMRSNE